MRCPLSQRRQRDQRAISLHLRLRHSGQPDEDRVGGVPRRLPGAHAALAYFKSSWASLTLISSNVFAVLKDVMSQPLPEAAP
jgi:hypothetical protein